MGLLSFFNNDNHHPCQWSMNGGDNLRDGSWNFGKLVWIIMGDEAINFGCERPKTYNEGVNSLRLSRDIQRQVEVDSEVVLDFLSTIYFFMG